MTEHGRGRYRDAKDEFNGQFAHLGKSLANRNRVEIPNLLAQGERSAEVLVTRAFLGGPAEVVARGELLTDGEIVAYGRGSYCALAPTDGVLFRQTGRRARRLEEGFPEWRLAGLPVVSEPMPA